MPVSVNAARNAVIEFCRQYPIALKVGFVIREKQEEAIGYPEATIERAGKITGAYFPARQRIGLAVSNIRDEGELVRTLRHELLGHLGINTFSSHDKRALLASIEAARGQPGLNDFWADALRLYPNASSSRQAEEIFACVCEHVTPDRFHRALAGQDALSDALSEVCQIPSRLISLQDLIDIASFVADGLHRNQRYQGSPRFQCNK